MTTPPGLRAADLCAPPMEKENWPEPLDAAALHGLAGDVVRLIEPHTESDPVAILVQFLIAFGAACGREPHFRVEADRHGLNLFGVIVGNTSRARKGTSLGWIRKIILAADPTMETRVVSGLSSGEGLINAVRDPMRQPTTVKDARGKVIGTELQTTDDGVADKRLLVLEGEYASTMKVAAREGNTLSPIMRNAWDGIPMQTMTKGNPQRVAEPHIAIIGHITRDELLRHMASTEAANGYANRFLWICARRSKFLPEGGNLSPDKLDPLILRVGKAIEFAKNQGGKIARNAAARMAWEKVYPVLARDEPGLAAAITARGEAIVTRLSAIYAALDCSSEITEKHLMAALAVWGYAEESVRCTFGDKFGDPTADAIRDALRSAGATGLTRTQISGIFGRHTPTQEIERALGQLEARAKARRDREPTGGAPIERWFTQ